MRKPKEDIVLKRRTVARCLREYRRVIRKMKPEDRAINGAFYRGIIMAYSSFIPLAQWMYGLPGEVKNG